TPFGTTSRGPLAFSSTSILIVTDSLAGGSGGGMSALARPVSPSPSPSAAKSAIELRMGDSSTRRDQQRHAAGQRLISFQHRNGEAWALSINRPGRDDLLHWGDRHRPSKCKYIADPTSRQV